MEITIVIAILAALAVAILLILNPKTQIEKSWDSKKKHELKTLQQVFEDFYNDKNCYPKPAEVCYNTPTQLSDNTYTCNICGQESTSPDFSPYLTVLPCDPQSPTKQYLYQVDNNSCPSWYQVYADLNNSSDSAISEVGCENGCGTVSSGFIYDYGTSSPNTDLETGEPITQYACYTAGCTQCTIETCSTDPADYCNDTVLIVNNEQDCINNCPCDPNYP